MLYAFVTMLLCQLVGEVFVRALALAVPGPVVGMVLLASRRSPPGSAGVAVEV
jgi:holin-like protein